VALRIALIYSIFSIVWIYLGDQLLHGLSRDPLQATNWQTIKGAFFVFFSATLIYVLLYKVLKSLSHEQLQAQRLAEMTRHSPAVTICWRNTPGWPVTYVSENIDQWGYAADAFRTGEKTFASLIHPDDLPTIEAEAAKSVDNGPDNYRQQYRFLHGSGHWIWLEDRVWLIRDNQGRVTESHGVLIDVSQEKRLREELQVGEVNYKMLFEANPHPMWVFDLDSLAFLAVNHAAVACYGYSREEFLSMTIRNIRPPEDIGKLQKNIDNVTSGLDEAGVWQHITKDGRLLLVEIVSHTLMFEGRRAEVVLAHDVTERLHAEKALFDSNAELKKRNRVLEQFNYAISHELKTPLVSIESSLGLIQSSLPQTNDPELTTAFGYARTATRQMNNLLESLLLMFRIDAASNDTDTNACGVLIQDAVEQLTNKNKLEGIRMNIAAEGPTLKGDRHKLVQIWLQLLENAAKYMGDQQHPAIDVGVEQTEQEVQFYVRDNGMGIEQSCQGKIFGLFDQLDKTATGTGLGLTLVQRVVDYYGGTIRVESAGTGQGSCFYFTVPDALSNKDRTI